MASASAFQADYVGSIPITRSMTQLKKKDIVLRYLGISEKSAHFNNNSPEVMFDDITWVDIPLTLWEELHTPFEITVTIKPGDTLDG